MKRSLIKETTKLDGKKIKVCGWVNSFRDHGKIVFIDLRDRTGILQVIFDDKVYKKAKELQPEWVLLIEGKIKQRPEKMQNKEIETGKIEMEGEKIEILSKTKKEPLIDFSKKELNLKLATLLDNRVLVLRHEQSRIIFKIFETTLEAYRKIMKKLDFTEIKTPKIIGTASEGGANFFTFDYFGKKAFLAQSPQFYKQIMVGVFERVFEIGPVFRKEPHFTTRHMNEYISLDAEMGFIEGMEDIMDEFERVIFYLIEEVSKKHKKDLNFFGVEKPKIPKKIPRIKLQEMKKIIKEEYGYEVPGENDIDPEGEKLAGKYAREKWSSDLLFLTHYPKSKRPFYTMPSKDNLEETEGFDLIFKGLELATGSQRIHDYDMLKENIKKRKLNPDDFEYYLEVFKYGMPPHGGWALGCERLVCKLLNLSTVKKASLFPRDVRRLIP